MAENDWLKRAQRLQAIAQSGLTFATDPFDVERYEAIRAIAAEIIAAGFRAADLAATTEYLINLFTGETGYATPKLDVRGAVFRAGSGGTPSLLLVREKSDGGWTLPGGWVDVGESVSGAVEKEVREESGFVVRATKILGVLDRARQGHSPLLFAIWKVFVRCEIVGGAEIRDAVETVETAEINDVSFFTEQEALSLPLSQTRTVAAQITRLFEHERHLELPTDFD